MVKILTMEKYIPPKLILPKLRRHPEFRGQSVDTGEWVFGSLLDHTLPDGCCDFYAAIGVPYQDGIGVRLKPIPVKVETVGEFVGFYYGFKVFEDDIIHLKGKEYDKDFWVVRWHENGYFYIDNTFGEFPKDCVKPVGDFFDSISTDFKGTQITVSGNIHDRPELWKGK